MLKITGQSEINFIIAEHAGRFISMARVLELMLPFEQTSSRDNRVESE